MQCFKYDATFLLLSMHTGFLKSLSLWALGKTNFISRLHPKLSYTKFNFWSSYFSFLSAPSIYKIIGLGTLNIHAKNKNALVSQFKVKRAVYVFAWVLLADLLCLFSSMQEWCGHWSSILSDFGKSEKHHVAFVFDSWCVLLWIKEVAFFLSHNSLRHSSDTVNKF